MRLGLGLLIVPLVGCSQILGIQDPNAGSGSGTDAAIDGPPAGDHLEFSIGNFSIAQQQAARFQVLLVHQSGQKEDVTGSTMLTVTSQTAATGALTQDDTARIFSAGATGSSKLVAAYPSASSASIIATVTTFTCHPVINEFQTGGATAADEFVEIFNPCTTSLSVDGWTLKYRAAKTTMASDDTLAVTLAGTMAAGEVRLYASTAFTGTGTVIPPMWTTAVMAADGGGLGLRDSAQTLIDAVGYGTAIAGNPFIEGSVATAPPPSQSLSRSPFDGRDDGIGALDGNNSANFTVTAATTPGARNFP